MEDKKIACEQEPLLLWHAGRALSEEESRQVARHLEGCSRCRERLAETETLVQLFRSTPAPAESHPSSEDLSRLAEGDFQGLALARGHVAACSECREILSVVEKVNRDLDRPAGELGRRLAEGWRSFGEGLRVLARGPLPGYVLALLLIYPAYLGVFGSAGLRERVRELEAPQLLDAPLPLDAESERGAGVGTVRVERSGGRTVLTFFVPISSERYRYQVELLRSGRGEEARVFLETDARSFDGSGTFALLLPERMLVAGAYEVRVEELHKTSGARVNLFSFPFRIED
jgi:hypothetical protein